MTTADSRKRRKTQAYGDVVVRALRPRADIAGGAEQTPEAPKEETTQMWRLERPEGAGEVDDREEEWHEGVADPLGETVPLPLCDGGG